MTNRLALASSPYLQQHRDNPVDWQEWGEAAFREARDRDVPVLLSVGYAACHWCHVMAHDSFEDEDVAALMNKNFVNVKVDREERPDIDAVYMQATTALTGQGGWPMTCLLTPDGSPFFAGTFFPRAQFQSLLISATRAWDEQRDEVLAAGQRIVTALADLVPTAPDTRSIPGPEQLDAAALRLAPGYDEVNGGFGGAPKFPPSMVLEFLLRRYERTGDVDALRMVEGTCEAMARGGMYDQLAGGFARYSVDAAWVVPHFEKMLYDNALLLRVYLHWWRITGSPLAERVARETADFLIRDLGTVDGGFASALDADTDGVEGLTYAWTPAQLTQVLGPRDAARTAKLLNVTAVGTFEKGASTLQLREDAADPAWWEEVRIRLLEARSERPQPARDDKVVTAWNGLAIAALAEAGMLLDGRYLAAARQAGELMLRTHLVDGRLRRTSLDGVAGEAAGVAEDYGDLADGLLMLHQATAEPRWLEAAGSLLGVALRHFLDRDGSLFDTADDAEQLVQRPKDPSDNAAPSGQSAVANALLTYSALTGSLSHREAAERALQVVSWLGTTQPRFLGWGLAAAEGLVAGPVQIAIVGERPAPAVGAESAGERTAAEAGPLTELAWRQRPPGAVIVSGDPDAERVPLLQFRPLVAGSAAAYVCYGMVCDAPTTSGAALAAALSRRG
ncbi:thioredoxin domain-containing protein [Jatrophihabitans sp. GAS493]|uniref:thioredoxin domain-containing protein n=1 Tax=Jatrophihabitans sp. GAS493 TaxID=1907575 RepID=UPI000BB8268E|nr:thioredoxin domain-containing protein [Jatrophihabitans sp. GAS493]